MKNRASGGCQCGHVRYEITGPLHDPHICHCRMCQKAFGNFFAALVGCEKTDLRWTAAEPAYFRSSQIVKRGFCPQCGTPLTFAYDNAAHMNVSIGSLDKPDLVLPRVQYGIEGQHPSFPQLHTLPGTRTEDDIPPDEMEKLKSLQFPD